MNKTYYKLIAACFLPVLLFLSIRVLGQDNLLFGTDRLEKHLKRQYKLTPNDVNRLRPLLKRENENVVLILGRFSDDETADFLSLWDGLRESRTEFEAGNNNSLTSRQRRALRWARYEFEARVLDVWLDDHVEFLARFLELDGYQLGCVRKIFEDEREKRHDLIVKEKRIAGESNVEWQKLTEKREKHLESILSSSQFREYRSLEMQVEGLIARK